MSTIRYIRSMCGGGDPREGALTLKRVNDTWVNVFYLFLCIPRHNQV